MIPFRSITGKQRFHSEVYYFGLALLVISLPLSVFGISLSQFILAGNWILEGQFSKKIEQLRKNKGIAIFLILYLVHLIWLFNTNDFSYALKDLRIKLPLLILPLIIGTSRSLDEKRVRGILLFFSAGVVVASFISTAVLLGAGHKDINDYREISIYVSHIRFSLMINIVIFLLYDSIIKNQFLFFKSERYILAVVVIWLAVFLFILRSQTGLVVFCLLGIYFVSKFLISQRKVLIRIPVSLTLLLLLAFFFFTFQKAYHDYYTIRDTKPYEAKTHNGRPYIHNLNDIRYENGYGIWVNFCEEELKAEWNKRSDIKYDSCDKKGNLLAYTLTRYLSSKGLRKDSAGVASLKTEDISAIENGYPNYIYIPKYSLYSFFYKQIWIIDSYLKGDDPSGHSLTQRMEYLCAASQIICDHFWLGTGTGDVQKEFNNYYQTYETQLEKKCQLRAHNQWVTFFLTFGIFGFVLITVAVFLPVITERVYRSYYFMLPFVIGLISFLNEDTLETQAGVTLFTFFYVFFLVNPKQKTPQEAGSL
jgi:O-antigen ligase